MPKRSTPLGIWPSLHCHSDLPNRFITGVSSVVKGSILGLLSAQVYTDKRTILFSAFFTSQISNIITFQQPVIHSKHTMPPSTKDKESAISKPTSGRREKSSAISKESRANLQTDKETRFFLCGRMASIESQYYSLPISQSELDGTQDDRENLARYLKAFSTIEEALTNIFDVPDPYSDRRKT